MWLGKDRGINLKGVRALFAKNFITRRRKLIYTKLVEVVPSHSEYDFGRAIGTVPQLEEVYEDAEYTPVTGFREYAWDWRNRLFQAIIGIRRSSMDFDQTGQVKKLIPGFGARLANLPDAVLVSRLYNDSLYSGEWTGGVVGSTKIKLFSSSHLTALGTTDHNQANTMTGSTPTSFVRNATPVTVALQIQNDFRIAKATIRSFKDDQNQPFHDDDLPAESFVIFCGPLMEEPMRLAFFENTIGGTGNPLRNAVREIVTTNYWPVTGASACDWFIFLINELGRPLILSEFHPIRPDQIEDYTDLSGELPAGISRDDLQALSSVRISTNIGNQGTRAEADTILNRRFLVGAERRLEIIGGEWKNAFKVENTA